MSFSVSASSQILGSQVLSLFGGSQDSLLATLYAPTTTASSASALQALQTAEANETKDVAATAATPSVARDIAAFRSAVAAAKSPSDVLANPTALKVLLTANGLGDQVAYTALAQKVLLSNSADPNALVNTIGSSTWSAATKTYDFANQGLAVLGKSSVLDTIANGYAEVQWRQSLDATTPGLSSALTFRAEAATVKTADQVLGDPILRDVVTTALGIPEQIAFQDIGAQEQAINTRLDFSRMGDPHYVDGLTQQYLTAKANAAAPQQTDLFSLSAQLQGLTV